MNTEEKEQSVAILTTRQQECLNYMRGFLAEYDRLPSSRAVMLHFGYSSQTSAQSLINALRDHGCLERISLEGDLQAFYRFARP